MSDWSGYNGDTVHDMWVDGMYGQDGYDDSYGYTRNYGGYVPMKRKRRSELERARSRVESQMAVIKSYHRKIANVEAKLSRNPSDTNIMKRLHKLRRALAEEEARLPVLKEQLAQAEKKRTAKLIKILIGLIIWTVCITIIILALYEI